MSTKRSPTTSGDDEKPQPGTGASVSSARFFDQRIYGRGYPKVKASFKHDAEKDEATLTIEQTQVDEKKSVGVFHFPVEVDVEDDKGWRKITLDLEETEGRLIREALERSRNNQSGAAKLLGISRDTLRYRMKKHGLL